MNNSLPELREEYEMSQADLAEAVGVTRQTINAAERERYDPSLELALKLARLFDRPVEEIFHLDDPDLGGNARILDDPNE